MIYLAGLLFEWIARAVIPTMVLCVAGVLVMLGVWRFVLRPRHLSSVKGWVLVGLIVVGFGTWRTYEVLRRFSRPELHMFREYVANPIPKEVRGLASATAAPVTFHDGAYILFHAPPAVVEKIVNHSIPGSKTLGIVKEMKRQSPRDSADRVVVVAADGQSYLKVGPEWARQEKSPESEWAGREVGNFLKTREGSAYLLLRAGDWGSFVSVLEYEPGKEKVVIMQYLTRRRF